MADLTVTAGNVVAASTAIVERGTAGATITAGMLVYKDTSDSDQFKACDTNGATSIIRTLYGIALNGASDGQPLAVCTQGDVNPGATVTVGTIYVASATAGGIAPSTDLAQGHYTSIFGIGTTSSNISVKINNGGAAVP
jgi:hypothetical protein